LGVGLEAARATLLADNLGALRCDGYGAPRRARYQRQPTFDRQKQFQMAAVYAATSPEWLRTIRTLPVGTELAFWQPTPAEPRRIAIGERWYFKERGRPLIHGFGLFQRWETGSLAELFQRYGSATGYQTANELALGIQVLREGANLATTVGNVVLVSFNEFDPPRSLAAFGLEDLSVRFRYIDGPDPLASEVSTLPYLDPRLTSSAPDAMAIEAAVENEAGRLAAELTLDELLARYAEQLARGRPTTRHLSSRTYERNPLVIAIARLRAGTRCEVRDCPHPIFVTPDGVPYIEVHHIDPLADGGEDTIENVACVCPAHHREVRGPPS